MSWRKRDRVRFTVACCLVLGIVCMPATNQTLNQPLVPAQVPVPASFFGMHIHHLADAKDPQTPWPSVTIPEWRLWDAHTAWPNLEPSRDRWDFDALDRSIDLAEKHSTDVMLTLAFTPSWASARPQEKIGYNPGWAAEPANLEDWRTFVQTVASRYKGRIHIYEIWNEPNLNNHYWTGSMQQMVALVAAAHEIIKKVDPSAIIVSPSPTGENGLVWLSGFLDAGGGRYVDVIGYHFYVFPGAPEAMVSLIKGAQAVLRGYGLSDKPLWDTEAGWSKPSTFSSENIAAGYLARAFILNWASGVRRLYWYSWDNHGWVTLQTTEDDNQTLKPAGIAFGVIQKWLTGAIVNWCSEDATHLWTCQIETRGTKEWLVWNPKQSSCITLPPAWQIKSVTPLLSEKHWLGDGCTDIGPAPELLTR